MCPRLKVLNFDEKWLQLRPLSVAFFKNYIKGTIRFWPGHILILLVLLKSKQDMYYTKLLD